METRKILNFISLILVCGFISTAIYSCINTRPKKDSSKVSEEKIQKEIEEYSYPLPSAFEVTEMLNSIEASYIMGIAHDPEKAESYFSEKSMAINLGIYSVDLAYASTYNQKAEIERYINATKELSLELDLNAAFRDDLPARLEANIDNKEKLVEIVTEMFQGAYSFLNKQGRAEVSYLILAGTVFEGLYLTTHISENTFQNPKVIETLLFQKSPLNDLLKLMSDYKDSEILKESYEDLRAIIEIYALEEGTTSMSKEQVEKLTATVAQIREKSVKI